VWRDYVSNLLGKDYEVLSCTDSNKALAKVKQGGIDMVILDHLMPGAGPLSLGMDLGAHLRRILPELPVIIYTGAWRDCNGADRKELQRKTNAVIVFKHGRDPHLDNLRKQVHTLLSPEAESPPPAEPTGE